ncbi:MAG: hypothetical protein V4735_08945 [Pseudomonadota bacterium]
MSKITPSTEANAPFTLAVRTALATTDTVQVNLFDRMLGAPRAEDDPSAAPHLPEEPPKKRRARKPKHKTASNGPAPMLGEGPFMSMVENDVDYTPSRLMPDALRAKLDAFRQDFMASVSEAPDIDALLEHLDAYVEKEHDSLFYQTNDYMSASIKHDYFSQFMNSLCLQLEKTSQLDPAQLKRIEDIEAAYQLGLDAYNLTGQQLNTYTHGETKSLLAEAERIRDTKTDGARPPKHSKKSPSLESYAHAAMHALLVKNYGLSIKGVEPSPLWIALANASERLARSQLQAAHPHLDFRDPSLASSEMMCETFLEIVDTWKEQVKQTTSPRELNAIFEQIQRKVRMTQVLPHNFSEIIEQSVAASQAETTRQLHTIFKDHQLMKPVPPARTQPMLDVLHPEYNTVGTLNRSLQRFMKTMKRLPECQDKYELLDRIEDCLDLTSDEILYYGTHPSTALAAQVFMSTFCKQMGAALHKAHCSDERFMASLKELEKKADLMHENQREVAHWLMQDTDGGHDSQFHYVLMTHGVDSRTIRPQDEEHLSDFAAEGMRQSAENRGIPPSLCDLPYMPLIYARCRDIAEAEIARDYERTCADPERDGKEKPPQSWVDRVSSTRSIQPNAELLEQYDGEPVNPVESTLFQAIRHRTLDLLNQSMSCLFPAGKLEEMMAASQHVENEASGSATDSKPDQTSKAPTEPDIASEQLTEVPDHFADYPIALTAHNLRIVMDFLDRMDRQITPSKLH